MKKLFAVLTAIATMTAMVSAHTVFSSAEEASAEVYVTISDENGSLVLTQEPTVVTDIDGDGVLTINDALYAAHEANYDGGAEAGYSASFTDYGLSLETLWGVTNGGSYGYYVNHVSAWSLEDAITDGDYINAFVYTDLTYWSDTYCYFNVNTQSSAAGESVTLTLYANGYDENWNAVTLPVENATITLNGEETAYTTDENGAVTLSLDTAGSYVVSAISETQTLVPPVCVLTVGVLAATTTTATASTTMETTTTTAAEESNMMGDVDGDEAITIQDASLCLLAYANHAVGNDYGLTDAQFVAADVDEDAEITLQDASFILTFYARNAVGDDVTWSDILDGVSQTESE